MTIAARSIAVLAGTTLGLAAPVAAQPAGELVDAAETLGQTTADAETERGPRRHW